MSSSNQRVVRINLCRMALSAFVELPYVLSMKSAATRAATEAPRRKGKTMLKLSDCLIRLWSEYRAEYQRVRRGEIVMSKVFSTRAAAVALSFGLAAMGSAPALAANYHDYHPWAC